VLTFFYLKAAMKSLLSQDNAQIKNFNPKNEKFIKMIAFKNKN
jgi:hypothetical protein